MSKAVREVPLLQSERVQDAHPREGSALTLLKLKLIGSAGPPSALTLSGRLLPRWSMQCMCVHAREASAPADAPRLARSIRRAQAPLRLMRAELLRMNFKHYSLSRSGAAAADARRRGRACPCSAGEMEHETRGDVRA